MKTRKEIKERIKGIEDTIKENDEFLNRPLITMLDEQEVLLDTDVLKYVKGVLEWVIK